MGITLIDKCKRQKTVHRTGEKMILPKNDDVQIGRPCEKLYIDPHLLPETKIYFKCIKYLNRKDKTQP